MQSWPRQQCAWYLTNLLWFSGIFAVEIQRNSHDNSVWRGSTAAKKADALIRCRCASFFVVLFLLKKKNKDRLRHKSGRYTEHFLLDNISHVQQRRWIKKKHTANFPEKIKMLIVNANCILMLILISIYIPIIGLSLQQLSYTFHVKVSWSLFFKMQPVVELFAFRCMT